MYAIEFFQAENIKNDAAIYVHSSQYILKQYGVVLKYLLTENFMKQLLTNVRRQYAQFVTASV